MIIEFVRSKKVEKTGFVRDRAALGHDSEWLILIRFNRFFDYLFLNFCHRFKLQQSLYHVWQYGKVTGKTASNPILSFNIMEIDLFWEFVPVPRVDLDR